MPTTPTDPLFVQQWHLNNTTAGQYDLNLLDVWDDYTGNGINITVIDSRVDRTHVDLDDNYDFTTDWDYIDNDTAPQSDMSDGERHGTAVMGIIAAEAGNGVGGVGVAYNSTVRSYGGLSFADLDEQLLDAAGQGDGIGNIHGNANGSDIVSMSFGINVSPGSSPSTNNTFNNDLFGASLTGMQNAISSMETGSANGRGGLGTIYVKSSGNSRANANSESREEGTADGMDTSKYTINVAATRMDGWIDNSSTPGANVLISAPTDNLSSNSAIVTTDLTGTAGYNTSTTANGGDYHSSFGGTSSAAPQVSGVIALMLEANSSLGWRDVQKILAYSARQVGSEVGENANTGAPVGHGWEQGTVNGDSWFWNGATDWNGGGLHFSNDYGFGMIDGKAAVRLAESWQGSATSANDVQSSLDMDGFGVTTNYTNTFTTFTATETTNLKLEHVNLNLDFTIDDMNDMEIFLTSPSGTRIQLINDTGGAQSFQNGPDWDFGTVAFWGETSAGVWTVEIRNDDGSGAGAFQSTDVDLQFSGSTVNNDDLFIVTHEFSRYDGVAGHSSNFNGGSGVNTINAAAVDSSSTINLLTNTHAIDGVSGTNSNINKVYTGDGDDTITGDGVSTMLSSGRGEDVVTGGGSSETIYGGAGNDTLDGGGGNDTIYGLDGSDVIFGGTGDDTSYGGNGNDDISTGGGTDVMYGGDGNDDFNLVSTDGAYGLIGLHGGTGHNEIVVESGGTFDLTGANVTEIDEIRFQGSANEAKKIIISAKELDSASEFATNLVIDGFSNGSDQQLAQDTIQVNLTTTYSTVDLSSWTFQDWFSGADTVSILGSTGADSIIGTSELDLIDAGAGADTVNAGAGNDTISDFQSVGATDVDSFDGGAGIDTLIHNSLNWVSSVVFNLATGEQTVNSTVYDRYANIENLVIGGGAGAVGDAGSNVITASDTFYSGDNSLSGGAGNDTIFAGDGNDSLFGGSGADELYGGDGDDYIEVGDHGGDTAFGGGGNDTLLRGAGNSLLNEYYGGTGTDTIRVTSGQGSSVVYDLAAGEMRFVGSQYEIWQGFENFDASGSSGGQGVIGTAGNNVVQAGSGANSISGMAGDDTLHGNGGNDSIDGGAGMDVIYGGAGNDTLVGGIGTDTIYGGDGDDDITSDGDGGEYYGGADNDYMRSGIGDETMDGGTGVDTIDHSIYNDLYTFDMTTGGTNFPIESFVNFENVIMGNGNNSVTGTTGANVITTGSGNDTIAGLGGDDSIFSGAGDDVITVVGTDTVNAGSGDDQVTWAGATVESMDGGAGIDTIDHSNFSWSATTLWDLEAGTRSVGSFTGTWLNFENTTNTNASDRSKVYGTSGSNVITSGGGDNTLDGRAGDDTLDGGAGNDLLIGGVGNDSLSGGTGNDNLNGSEGNDSLFAGDGNDTASGSDGNDYIHGGAGNDTLYGGAGNDLLEDGAGADKLYGGADDDRLRILNTNVVFGQETIEGGAGTDSLEFWGADGSITDLRGSSISSIEILRTPGFGTSFSRELRLDGSHFDTGGISSTAEFDANGNAPAVTTISVFMNGQTNFDLSGITFSSVWDDQDIVQILGTGIGETITGTSKNDSIYAGGGNDLIYGGDGDDLLYGGTDNDTLYGGADNDSLYAGDGSYGFMYGGDGDDTLTGGAGLDNMYGGAGANTFYGGGGIDRVFYVDSVAGVEVNLGTGSVAGGDAADDVIGTDIEQVYGSNTGGDTLTGSDADNTISGNAGDDTLYGGIGDDRLNGGNDEDTMYGGVGMDEIYGGNGDDLAYGGDGEDEIYGDYGHDKIYGGANNDTFWGDDGDDTFYGGDGNDRVYAEGDDDRIYGGDGADGMYGGLGADRFYGGAGSDSAYGGDGDDYFRGDDTTDSFYGGDDYDYISYYGSADGVTVDLGSNSVSGGHATGDVIDSIEGINGSNAGGDTITGTTGVNTIRGYGGEDKLYGGAGDDSLNGGNDNDRLYGGEGADSLVGGNGNDRLYGGLGSDIVYGGDGDDYFRGDDTADSFYGGDDYDYISYYGSSVGVTVDLGSNSVSGGHATGDVIDSIEGINGSNAGGDTITGTSGTNTIRGYGGDDKLYGGDGDDSLNGGNDNDSLYGGEGADSLVGGNGNDRLYGGLGSDIVFGGAGDDFFRGDDTADSYYGGTGFDNISYYGSADGVTVNLTTNSVSGGHATGDVIDSIEGITGSNVGDDKITGTSGANTLKGAGGDDSFYAGAGNDVVYGGAGDDYVRVAGGTESFYGGSGSDDYISYYDSVGGITIRLETDSISGSWGVNDVISGFESAGGSNVGGDKMYGGAGDNRLKSYGGDDTLYGGSDDDKLYGGSGEDKLYGGTGADKLYGGSDDDYMRADGGQESFYGGTGTDDFISYYKSSGGVNIDLQSNSVSGSWSNNDVISGFESASGSNTGDDRMYGTSGANRLKGNGGDDSIWGRSGDDKLYGGGGVDRFDGGAGTDSLYGGDGDDIFHFDRGEGTDYVKDFANNEDTIQFDNFGYLTDAASALAFATESGGDVTFDFGVDGMVIVENTSKAALANDIEIV